MMKLLHGRWRESARNATVRDANNPTTNADIGADTIRNSAKIACREFHSGEQYDRQTR
jgi:hypothetical protein